MELDVPVKCWRGTSYGLLVALTLWQLWTVLLTLVPADKVKTSLDYSDAHAETITGIMSLGQKQRKPTQD
jgi:hypothetical protein